MKKEEVLSYEKAELKLVTLDVADVIRTSGEDGTPSKPLGTGASGGWTGS